MAVLDLSDKTVIVTGASSGIGEATARLLHEAGAQPVLAARRADRLHQLGEQLGGALAVPTDVTDPAEPAGAGRRPPWTGTAGSTAWSTTPAPAS